MNSDQFFDRLNETRIRRLAELLGDHVLSLPIAALFPPERTAVFAEETLRGLLRSEEAHQTLAQQLQAALAALEEIRIPLDEALPGPLLSAVESLSQRSISPDKATVLAVLDRPPLRELVRALLQEVLLDFGRNFRAPVEGVAKGLSGLARFAAERTGSLGSLVTALGSEVERQLERKASEFADAALFGLIHKLAEELSNPSRLQEQRELRQAIFEGLFALKGTQWARELGKLDLSGSAKQFADALEEWLASPQGKRALSSFVTSRILHAAEQTARDALAELGVLEQVQKHLAEAMALHLRGAFGNPAFRHWLKELFEESP